MTADVNSAAAACPHPPLRTSAKANKSSGDNVKIDESKRQDKSCSVDPTKNNSHDASECPIDGNSGLTAELLRVANHAAGFSVYGSNSNLPCLSKSRVVSSIPKGELTPEHQTGNEDKWEYPSEDMYFKAMKRKGWAPKAEQMKTIVAIHNTVNEQSWREVLKWESFHPAKEPVKLKKFLGKPTEYSPKAKLMNLLGWSVLPFDRHDWIVDRDGKEVRYVIDFYSGASTPGKPLSVYLDVRPALDSVESVLDRLRWQFFEKIAPLLPFHGGIYGVKPQAPTRSETEDRGGHSKIFPKK
ncbi:cytochrome c1 heme lyase [Plasmopara halstedii]|uniref:Holocytochrome c-type synthase n=1 Tax=Plasmopara halstedii TaxID=4781 RepID=A0A0P1AMH7_PLAHL|nr:cytochrome c1 heme lyase [Plasmopara halstedii]CEG42213.1 cytochrome c1 heme lyase [Plasmopara halstedii]|eukprot:XP_024578582.1 cytochrome c1 heme lyase [Plasmopara halstedii]